MMDFRIKKKKEYLISGIAWTTLAFLVLAFVAISGDSLKWYFLIPLSAIEFALAISAYTAFTRNGGVYLRLEEKSLRVMSSVFRKPAIAYTNIRQVRQFKDQVTIVLKEGQDVKIMLEPMEESARREFVRSLKEKAGLK
jgi:hypothetical protein